MLYEVITLFAAAADKTGTLSLDMIVTVNGWLGLNEDTNGNTAYYNYGGYNHVGDRYAGIEPILLVGPEDLGDGLDWFYIGPRSIMDEVTFNELPSWYETRITSYNVCYTKLLRGRFRAGRI